MPRPVIPAPSKWPASAAAAGLTSYVIQDAVAKDWGVTAEGLRSKTRTKNLTVPRQVAMFLMREMLGMQLVEIGASFGGRDHSTVIHSLERATAMIAEEPATAQRVSRLRVTLEALRALTVGHTLEDALVD